VKLVPNVEELLDDPSPLVRAMAVWALHRLAPERANELAPQHLEKELDEAVRAEWTIAPAAA
jgi:epoxyqueuosine reductase